MDKISDYKKQMEEMEEIQKVLEELHENKTALYEEERRLRANEPEFFPEADFTELFPEGEEDIMDEEAPLKDEEYPVYPPPQADSDYDYTEFELITANSSRIEEEDYYGEEYEDYYGEYFPAETRDKRDTTEVLEGLF